MAQKDHDFNFLYMLNVLSRVNKELTNETFANQRAYTKIKHLIFLWNNFVLLIFFQITAQQLLHEMFVYCIDVISQMIHETKKLQTFCI